MSPEALVSLMHDALLRIQRDVACLSEAVQKQESDYYLMFCGGPQLTDYAIEVRARIELIVTGLEPLVLEHIATSAKQGHDQAVH